MKLIGTAVAGCLWVFCGSASAIPITYILDGDASGSYAGIPFSGHRLGILMEGDTDTVTSGYEPYIQGNHPEYRWFTQPVFSRIQVLFPPDPSAPSGLPYPMGLANPESFQLMSWNIGAYRSNAGIYSPPSYNVALCGNGLNKYDCFASPAFAFGVTPPLGAPNDLETRTDFGAVSRLSFDFDFTTTRGGLLHIERIEGASFDVRPVPEPGITALMLAGVGFVAMALRRRAGRREGLTSGLAM